MHERCDRDICTGIGIGIHCAISGVSAASAAERETAAAQRDYLLFGRGAAEPLLLPGCLPEGQRVGLPDAQAREDLVE